MLIGYMRVSSSDERQSVALQRDALLRPEWKFIGRVLPANAQGHPSVPVLCRGASAISETPLSPG